MSSTNGGQNGGPPQAAATQPQLSVLAQYIKDLSFENPLAPRTPQQNQQQPAISIQVGVQARPLTEPNFEVMLKLEGKATLPDNNVLFAFELEYAGVFRVQNVPPESVQPMVMIECPRLLFPFAREIVATTVAAGGFPALMLDPVDFVSLYRQSTERPQGGAGAPMQA